MITLAGKTLHSGIDTRVTLHPSDVPEVQIRYQKTIIPAALPSVVATPRCTVLGTQGVHVALVEHLLAACHILHWWSGLIIEVSAEELPILDGSAQPWADALATLGPPPPAPPPLVISRVLTYTHEHSHFTLTPTASPQLEVTITFDNPIGKQNWSGTPATYPELLAARTFGFAHEVKALQARGLIQGAGLDNALVISDNAFLNIPRSADEPVKHKALDALGDLFLLGQPLAGALQITRGSHAGHVAFAHTLKGLAQNG